MINPKVMISGGFDPLHVGHIALIQHAATLGSVIVALNSDQWVMRKKGYCVMSWRDRADILKMIRGVHEVVEFDDHDDTVCAALQDQWPAIFVNGGDREAWNGAEHAVCVEKGIVEAFNVGGVKIRSSSSMVETPLRSFSPPARGEGN